MQVIYGGVNLGMCRLEHLEINPWPDEVGQTDIQGHEITLMISCPLNPMATATNKVIPGFPFGGIGVAGDRLGITIPNLKDALSTPRQLLRVIMGADVMISSPSFQPDGATPYSCDLRSGPRPGKMIIREPIGDKTGFLIWSVTTTVSPCNRWLLSNRWTPSVKIGQDGESTRVIEGQAVFRLDFLRDSLLTADDFRQFLLCPVPVTMQRKSIDVSESDDGSVLYYRVEDSEVGYGFANGAGISRIQGNVTAGPARATTASWAAWLLRSPRWAAGSSAASTAASRASSAATASVA